MVLKIILTVLFWSYALLVYFSGRCFIKNAPKGCEEGRALLVSFMNIFVTSVGFLLTAMFWSN